MMKSIKYRFIVATLFLVSICYIIIRCTEGNKSITLETKDYEDGYWVEESDKETIVKEIESTNGPFSSK